VSVLFTAVVFDRLQSKKKRGFYQLLNTAATLAREVWKSLAGLSEAWMPKPSPHGWVHGVYSKAFPDLQGGTPLRSSEFTQISGEFRYFGPSLEDAQNQ
jgi:hypothetical protein